MADTMYFLKSQLLKLMPFFNSVVIYFAFVQNPHGELWTTILKCVPIVMLMFYVVAKGFDLTPAYERSQRILLGLICSCAGDALLNINLFPHGMGAFALAHIWYISAFGWQPLKLSIGITLYIAGAVSVWIVFNRLDTILAIGLPIYAALLVTTFWRALARALHSLSLIDITCALGAALFLISDLLIGVNMFLIAVPYSRIFIMTTYYLAQLAIAFSTANEGPELWKHMGNGKQTQQGQRVKAKD